MKGLTILDRDYIPGLPCIHSMNFMYRDLTVRLEIIFSIAGVKFDIKFIFEMD